MNHCSIPLGWSPQHPCSVVTPRTTHTHIHRQGAQLRPRWHGACAKLAMFAFSQSQASSAAATASPASSYQGEGASPAISPASPGARKRQIAHDDRELSEIKRRMWGLRVHCDAEAAGGVGPAALGALGAVPEAAVEEEEEAMDSDASDGQAAGGGGEEDGDGDGTPMVRSDSQGSSVSSASSSSSSGRGGSGRIGGDDPRALMLQALYQRRREPHEDKVEAKIESLIRASLRRWVCI